MARQASRGFWMVTGLPMWDCIAELSPTEPSRRRDSDQRPRSPNHGRGRTSSLPSPRGQPGWSMQQGSVENQLHWRLDVVMNEDHDRSRLDNAPHNLAVLRHMALNVMQKDITKGSLRTRFMRAGWDDHYLARLLALF